MPTFFIVVFRIKYLVSATACFVFDQSGPFPALQAESFTHRVCYTDSYYFIVKDAFRPMTSDYCTVP